MYIGCKPDCRPDCTYRTFTDCDFGRWSSCPANVGCSGPDAYFRPAADSGCSACGAGSAHFSIALRRRPPLFGGT
jgi:hypothetical protein